MKIFPAKSGYKDPLISLSIKSGEVIEHTTMTSPIPLSTSCPPVNKLVRDIVHSIRDRISVIIQV